MSSNGHGQYAHTAPRTLITGNVKRYITLLLLLLKG
jgi:hypothetical protein